MPDSKSARNDLGTKTFGHRQLDQMIADRPDMAGVLDEDTPLYEWIVDSLNGQRTGHRIYWNADSPKSGQGSEHAGRHYHYPAQIYVSGGTEMTPIDKWAGLIYEIFNLENSNAFEALDQQAYSGVIDGDTYALDYVELEFVALKSTQEFFRKYPLPTKGSVANEWYDWIQTDLGSFDDYVASYAEEPTGPGNFKHFRDYYDARIKPWIGYNEFSEQSQDDTPREGEEDDVETATSDEG